MLLDRLKDHYRHAVVAIVLLLSLLVTGHAVTGSAIIADHSDSGIINTMDGSGERPFVYRALLPQLTRAIAYVTPAPLEEAIGSAALGLWDVKLLRKLYILDQRIGARQMDKTQDAYKMVVYIALMYAALVFYALSLQELAQRFFPNSPSFALVAPVYGLFILLPFIDKDFHGYDFPTLAFFSLMLLLLHARKWQPYILCFALSCFNRETTIFMAGVFFFSCRRELGSQEFLRLLFWQFAIWCTITLALHMIFADHRNWTQPERLYVLGDELRTFSSNKLLHFIALWLLLSYKWEKMPPLLKNIVWLLPLNIILYLGFGMFREYRVFFELFPFLTMVTGYSLFARLDEKKA